MRPSDEKAEEMQVLGQLQRVKSALDLDKDQLPKRQAQRLRKEYTVLDMYFNQKIKTGRIASAVKMSAQEVGYIV